MVTPAGRAGSIPLAPWRRVRKRLQVNLPLTPLTNEKTALRRSLEMQWPKQLPGGKTCGSVPRFARADKAHSHKAQQYHGPGRRLWHCVSFQRERRIERRGWGPADDIRADAQPVRVEHRIAGPTLK